MGNLPVSILAVDDEESHLELLKSYLGRRGFYVETASDGAEAIDMLHTLPFDLILLDIMMPKVDGLQVLKHVKQQGFDVEVIMLSAVQDLKIAVECMSLGAFYYITKPYHVSDILTLLSRALERKHLVAQNRALRTELSRRALSTDLVGNNEGFRACVEMATRVAQSDSPVLIRGEIGTGKEKFALFLHNRGPREEQPFQMLSCLPIPGARLESELFGEEGSSTAGGTSVKQGLVELAHGGTLVLDEIGEMPMITQSKLLQFMQSMEFRRSGGRKILKSDVRIIATTSGDLPKAVAAGSFMLDLFKRISIVELVLPPLRERKDDIPLLADHFLKIHAGVKGPKHLDGQSVRLLENYDWPGNVGELENVIDRAAAVSQSMTICVDDLGLPFRSALTGGTQTTDDMMRA